MLPKSAARVHIRARTATANTYRAHTRMQRCRVLVLTAVECTSRIDVGTARQPHAHVVHVAAFARINQTSIYK
jgi:hypothetical protein